MALAVHLTAAPQYQPPQIVGRSPFDILDKRQQLTFSTCGLQCAAGDFCQQYRSNFGFCCPTSVLTRTAFNYCGPATTCIEYGVSSVNDFFFDSTSSIQFCGSDRPSCVTYIYRSDSFTQVFCASGESGTSFFDTTSTRGVSATFVGGSSTTTSPADEPTTEATNAPTATVVSRTRTNTADEATNNPDNTNPPTSSSTSDNSSGLSTGAVAGIGVGAAIAGIGAAVGAFFLWRRNSKKKDPSGGAAQQFPPQPPMATHGYDNNTGYYQQQQPYAQVPQGYQAELSGAGVVPQNQQDYYKGTYPPTPGAVPPVQNTGNVYELGGGGQAPISGQASPYHDNQAPPFRQELQG